jgi:SAP domain
VELLKEQTREELHGMTAAALKVKLVDLGLPVSGSKTKLVDRLLARKNKSTGCGDEEGRSHDTDESCRMLRARIDRNVFTRTFSTIYTTSGQQNEANIVAVALLMMQLVCDERRKRDGPDERVVFATGRGFWRTSICLILTQVPTPSRYLSVEPRHRHRNFTSARSFTQSSRPRLTPEDTNRCARRSRKSSQSCVRREVQRRCHSS